MGLPVLSNKVDIANARVEFENGAVANLTASRVSTERVRKFRYFQPNEYFSIDFTRRDATLIRVDRDGPTPQIAFRKLTSTPQEPFRRSWRRSWSQFGQGVALWSAAGKGNRHWH